MSLLFVNFIQILLSFIGSWSFRGCCAYEKTRTGIRNGTLKNRRESRKEKMTRVWTYFWMLVTKVLFACDDTFGEKTMQEKQYPWIES